MLKFNKYTDDVLWAIWKALNLHLRLICSPYKLNQLNDEIIGHTTTLVTSKKMQLNSDGSNILECPYYDIIYWFSLSLSHRIAANCLMLMQYCVIANIVFNEKMRLISLTGAVPLG